MATFARAYKEGQTYMQLRVMRPLLPGRWLALMPVQGPGWMFGVPWGPCPCCWGEPAARGWRGGLTATAPLPDNERIIFGCSS